MLPALALVLLPRATAGPSALVVPPGNDRCVDATIVWQFHQSSVADLAAATPDGASSCSGAGNDPDVWYFYVPRTSGPARFLACALPGSTLDPLLSVHAGCPGDASNEIACVDDATPGTQCAPSSAALHLAVVAGQAYWIRVASAGGTSGVALFSVTDVAPAAISDRAETALDVAPGEHFATLGLAPSGLPITCATQGVVYRYTPSVSGPVTASTCGEFFVDAMLGVLDGGTTLACAYTNCSPYQATATWSGVAGREYHVLVADVSGSEGPVRCVLTGPPRASDDCATAPLVPMGSRLIDLGRASPSGASACDAAPDSAWYARVVAPCDGVLRVTTCGTRDFVAAGAGPDTILSLHAACPADASTQLACSNDGPVCGAPGDATIERAVTTGETFLVRVTRDPASSRSLPVWLTIECERSDLVCAGDGSGTACPCGNAGGLGRGCASSSASTGAVLAASGAAHVHADAVTLFASGTTPSATGLYFQGDALAAGGSGIAFGDGLRCAVGATVRLGIRTSSAGSSSFGAQDGTGASVATAGHVPSGGGTRFYQLWYRDAAPFCAPAPFNLSNAVRITWSP